LEERLVMEQLHNWIGREEERRAPASCCTWQEGKQGEARISPRSTTTGDA